MTQFDKAAEETFYDVSHLFEHPKVVEEAIGDALTKQIKNYSSYRKLKIGLKL